MEEEEEGEEDARAFGHLRWLGLLLRRPNTGQIQLPNIKRRKLEDISREEDVESSTRKLLDQVAKLNDERFHAMMKLKDLLTEAVALKWSHTEKNMASIELDTKIWEMEKDVKKLEKEANQKARSYEDCKRITQEHRWRQSIAKQNAESIAMITKDLEKEFLAV